KLLKNFIPKEKRRKETIEPLLKEFILRYKYRDNLWKKSLELLKNN
ncbi:14336_t:CDS:1, partial [Racocetra persica]